MNSGQVLTLGGNGDAEVSRQKNLNSFEMAPQAHPEGDANVTRSRNLQAFEMVPQVHPPYDANVSRVRNLNTFEMTPVLRVFDSTVDGFGFSNYDEQPDCLPITTEQLYNQLWFIADEMDRMWFTIFLRIFPGWLHTFGHCFGISRVAAYYFDHPAELHAILQSYNLDNVAQISNYSTIPTIREKIEYEHGFGQFYNPNKLFNGVAYAIETLLLINLNLPSLEAEVQNILDTIETQGYAFVCLHCSMGSHSVLAYEGKYDSASDTYTLAFYDSNPLFSCSGRTHYMQLTHNSEGVLYISYDSDTKFIWENMINEEGPITSTWEYLLSLLLPKIRELFDARTSSVQKTLMELSDIVENAFGSLIAANVGHGKLDSVRTVSCAI